jgi:hypothetical protein
MPNRQVGSEVGRDFHTARSKEPPIVDPEEFLARPFQGIEAGRLATAPDIEFLRWLPTLKNETGLVLLKPDWYIIKGSSVGIPSWIIPPKSDVLLHSHPSDGEDKTCVRAFPSLGDFFNGLPTARNLIASPFGITQYFPIEDDRGRTAVEAEITAFSPRFNTARDTTEYLRFLEDVGARYEIHPWDRIDGQKLRDMLEPGIERI